MRPRARPAATGSGRRTPTVRGPRRMWTRRPPARPARLVTWMRAPRGSSEIELNWDAPRDDGGSAITGYRIEASADGGARWSTLDRNTGRTATSYRHTGLAGGTTHHYRVAAINAIGAGDFSDEDSATTDPRVPDAPRGLSARATGDVRHRVDLDCAPLRRRKPGHRLPDRMVAYRKQPLDGGRQGFQDHRLHAQRPQHRARTRHYRVRGDQTGRAQAPGRASPAQPPMSRFRARPRA